MTEHTHVTLTGETMLTTAGDQFPATRWTLVLAACNQEQPDCRAAFASLCEAYWYPLYAYLRRRGHDSDQARDLTQEFFVRLLTGRYIERADPEKGRFTRFCFRRSSCFFPTNGTAITRRSEVAARQRFHSRSPRERTSTSVNRPTTRRPSESTNGQLGRLLAGGGALRTAGGRGAFR